MNEHDAVEAAFNNGYDKGYADAIDNCERLLANNGTGREMRFVGGDVVPVLANQVASKWIPVTERLPEGDKVVLCYKADRGIRFGKLLDATYADGVQAFMDRDRTFAFGVTHWMPLPEPPKGE